MADIIANLTTPITVDPITTIQVIGVSVTFGAGDRYAVANYSLKDATGIIRKSGSINLTEQDLSGWGSDDTFVAQIISTKLQLQTQTTK